MGVFENNLDSIDTLIVISKSGQTKQVIDKVQMALNEDIQVVSFTGNNDNVINDLATIPLICKDDYPSDEYNRFANSFYPNIMFVFEYVISLFEGL